jgi:hypothetical protein
MIHFYSNIQALPTTNSGFISVEVATHAQQAVATTIATTTSN